jgi:hypothetical protein
MSIVHPAQNFLGKCKEEGCDYVIFATGEDVQQAETWRDVTPGTGVYRVGNYGRFARCTANHKVFPVKAVKGTYSEAHECDARCLNAKGWSCTCSCGGANHGRGHVATVVSAGDLKSAGIPVAADNCPDPERKHLGEVGKHIKGAVILKDKRQLRDDLMLYRFHTVDGENIIKWFVAPQYVPPGFVIGATMTIRAKVKRHDEFRGVPETVVTYVEEVV